MTRKQVRAAMRRMRTEAEEAEEETGEINLVPYMDIVTNIIIFLLASVANAVPLANVNVSVPSIGAGGSASAADEEKEEKEPLNLTVTAGKTGFIIAASGGVLPAIEKTPQGGYNYKALSEKLREIKENFPDETKGTFNADSDTPYNIVVETLDAMRMTEDGKTLFPDIAFAAGIL